MLSISFQSDTDLPSGTLIGLNGGVIRLAFNGAVSMSPTRVGLTGRKQPPNAVVATMSSTGNSITVTFDGMSSGKVSGVSSSGSCDLLLANSNLGQGALCVWTTLSTLVIYLGYTSNSSTLVSPLSPHTTRDGARSSTSSVVACDTATVPKDALLILRPGAVTAVPGGISKQPVQCLTVLPPASPVAPRIALSGATRLGACDSLFLDASGTVDFSGRSVDFVWSLSPSIQPVDGNASGVDLYTESLYVPSSSLIHGSSYNVSLSVTNFLGGTAHATIVVNVAATPLPLVSIDGAAVRSIAPGVSQVHCLALPVLLEVQCWIHCKPALDVRSSCCRY